MTAEKKLEEGLGKLGLSIEMTTPLMRYLTLLLKWNKAYNLTALTDPSLMVGRHLLDSLAISPFIQGIKVLDVGTGAGFPGIPLALAHKEYQFVLLDSNGKKTRFLEEVKRQLSLRNVEIIQSRAERYQVDQGFDTITSRAVSDVNDLVHWTRHLVTSSGIWVAMKGQVPEAELAVLDCPYRVEMYQVPGVEGKRSAVIIHA